MSAATELLSRLAPGAAERAAREFLTELLSGKPVPGEHPAVADLRALPVSERTLDAIVRGIGSLGAKTHSSLPAHSRAMLSSILDPALTVVGKEYPLPLHRRFCSILVAPDYKEKSYITAMDALTLEEVPEAGIYPTSTELDFQGTPERIAPKNYGRVVSISRQTIVNDSSCQYFADLARALTGAAYRLEAAKVFGMMEANPVLADGGQWFDSSNTYTGANPLSCLENGFEKFAGQQFPNGDYVGAVPTLLVVPPSWTLTVDDFTSDIVLQRPYLIKTPLVQNGYLIAGANCPSVALIGLDQTLLPQIETNPAPPKDFDIGLQAKVTHTFAVLPLQRAGIVRLAITP